MEFEKITTVNEQLTARRDIVYQGFEFKIIEKNNKEIQFLKNTAEKLQELNRELKEENDRYSEEQMNEMYKYYKNGGLFE